MLNILKIQGSDDTFSKRLFREAIIDLPVEELEIYKDIAFIIYGDDTEMNIIKEVLEWKKSKLGRELF